MSFRLLEANLAAKPVYRILHLAFLENKTVFNPSKNNYVSGVASGSAPWFSLRVISLIDE